MNLDTQLQIIGFTGGSLIIISLIPQLITIILNKSSKNISISMYFLLLIAQNLWVAYSILKNDMIILATNLSAAIITFLIIISALYFRYNKQDNKKEDKHLEMISITF